MTSEQAQWLRDHPDYTPLGVGVVYRAVGTLYPAGKLDDPSGASRDDGTGHPFRVGIRTRP